MTKKQVFDTVRSIVADKMEVPEDRIYLETKLLTDLEGDSLDAVEIIMQIEDEFGIEIPDEESASLINNGDMGSIVQHILDKISE